MQVLVILSTAHKQCVPLLCIMGSVPVNGRWCEAPSTITETLKVSH